MTPLRIYLRDINPAVVTAWHEMFDEVELVDVSEGNLFDLTADAIVSPANSFGYMDGGIDAVYIDRFGIQLQRRLQDVIRNEFAGELPVGQAAIVPTHDASIPLMVSAPTMRLPMNVAGTINAYLAFRATLLTVEKHNDGAPKPICSLLCPGLGTAVGRMPPLQCARQMFEAYMAVIMVGPDYFGSVRRIYENHAAMVAD